MINHRLAAYRSFFASVALVAVLPAQGTTLGVVGEGRSGSTLHVGVTTQNNAGDWPLCFVVMTVGAPAVPVSLQGVPLLVDLSAVFLTAVAHEQFGANGSNDASASFKWSMEVAIPPLPFAASLQAQAITFAAGWSAFDISNGVTIPIATPAPHERVVVTHYSGNSLVVQQLEPATGASTLVGSYVTCAEPYAEDRRPSVSSDGRYVTFSCPYGVGGMNVGLVDTTTGAFSAVPQYGSPATTANTSPGLFHPQDSDTVWSLTFTGVPCFANRLNYNLVGYSISQGAIVQVLPVLTNPTNCSLPGHFLYSDWKFTADGNYAVFRKFSEVGSPPQLSLVVFAVIHTPGQPLTFVPTPEIVLPVASPGTAHFDHEPWPVPESSIVLVNVIDAFGTGAHGLVAVDVQSGAGRKVSLIEPFATGIRYQDFADDGSWGLMYQDLVDPTDWWIFESSALVAGMPLPIVVIPNPMAGLARPNGTVALPDRTLLAYSGGLAQLYRIRFDANWGVLSIDTTSRDIDANRFVRIHSPLANAFGTVGLDTAVTMFDGTAVLVVRDFPTLIDPATMVFHSLVVRPPALPFVDPIPPAGWQIGNTSVHR